MLLTRGGLVVTKLERALRRELVIKQRRYIVTLDDKGLKLTLKGHRKGQELLWDDFVSGDAAFAVALNASLSQANDAPPPKAARTAAGRKSRQPGKSGKPRKRSKRA
jgi:hypothetical protein